MIELNSIAEACERIDILKQEAKALLRDNARLKAERDQAYRDADKAERESTRLRTELDAANAERDHQTDIASYYKWPHK